MSGNTLQVFFWDYFLILLIRERLQASHTTRMMDMARRGIAIPSLAHPKPTPCHSSDLTGRT